MKNWIFSTALLITGALFSNTAGFVEYDLPESAQSWPVIHQVEGTPNFVIGSITLEGTEFFGAAHDAEIQEIPNMAELQEGLQVPFPDQNIKATILESTENSVLYEWSASDENQELLHGWGRILSNGTGTISLNYTTGQTDRIDALRDLWVPVLKTARVAEQIEVEGASAAS